jgi:hypothetical protein
MNLRATHSKARLRGLAGVVGMMIILWMFMMGSRIVDLK